jgi:hypothetical protein
MRAFFLFFQFILFLYVASYGAGDLLEKLGEHLGLL